MSTDLLHTKANGSWSLAMAELNKWLFFKAYVQRIDSVAEKRALKESAEWLSRTTEPLEYEESPLYKRWISKPPTTDDDWKFWIAIHQRHLFVPLSVRGSFHSNFPALTAKSRQPDYKLTRLFYEGLLQRAE